MGMHMANGTSILAVPSEHLPGLAALVTVPVLVAVGAVTVLVLDRRGVAWAAAARRRAASLGPTGRAAVFGSVLGAVVHAALVPTHWGDARVTAVLFVVDAVGFLLAAGMVLGRRRGAELVSLAMLAGTAGGYLLYLVLGWEGPDPVGLISTGVELVAALVVADALVERRFGRRRLWSTARALPVAAAVLAVTVVWTGAQPAASSATAVGDKGAPAGIGAMPMGGAAASGDRAPASGMPAPSGGAGPAGGSGGGAMPMGTGASAGSSAASGANAPGGAMAGMGSSASIGSAAAGGSTGGGMGAMGGAGGSGGGSGSGGNDRLSLPTTSPAGAIVWPAPMGAMGPGMQLVTPDCMTTPTPQQQAAAVDLVDATAAAAAPFASLATAKADGYVPITPSGATVVHYAKPAYLRDGQTLDPGAIESLVYANTTHGAVLVAAMYTLSMDQGGDTSPPMPGGCLTEWHVHTNLCQSTTSGVIVGEVHGGTCPAGSVNRVTQPMIHVWLAPVPGGPLVVDAPDAQVVQAAEALPVPSPPNGQA